LYLQEPKALGISHVHCGHVCVCADVENGGVERRETFDLASKCILRKKRYREIIIGIQDGLEFYRGCGIEPWFRDTSFSFATR
jgi:hypothetical protein